MILPKNLLVLEECSMRRALRPVASRTRVLPRETRTLTSVLNLDSLSVMSKLLRFNVQRCGEKSPTLRTWPTRRLVKPTPNKTNRNILMLKLPALRCVLTTLVALLTPVPPTSAPSRSL